MPKPLCDLVHKLLRKKPEDRYQSFTEVLEDIRAIAKAQKSGTIAGVTITDSEHEIDAPPGRVLYGQRPWLTLLLLIFLTGSASAGVGWLMRSRISPESQAPAKIKKLATGREQFLQAMLLINNEDAWKAVGKYFANDNSEKLWVHRAEEQLLLFYLKDKKREQEALEQVKVLASLRSVNELFYTESRIAEAYLAAGSNNVNRLKKIMNDDGKAFQTQLTGAWKVMYQNLLMQVQGPRPVRGPRPGEPVRRNGPLEERR